jgi:Tfp pilus assembly protein PilF
VRRNPIEAEKHYIVSVTSNPQNSDALGSYASFLHGVTGDTVGAERYYKAALEIDDTHANNLCNYGLFLSEVKKLYNDAEGMYK